MWIGVAARRSGGRPGGRSCSGADAPTLQDGGCEDEDGAVKRGRQQFGEQLARREIEEGVRVCNGRAPTGGAEDGRVAADGRPQTHGGAPLPCRMEGATTRTMRSSAGGSSSASSLRGADLRGTEVPSARMGGGRLAIPTMDRMREVVDRAVPDPSWEHAMRFSTGRARGRWPSPLAVDLERVGGWGVVPTEELLRATMGPEPGWNSMSKKMRYIDCVASCRGRAIGVIQAGGAAEEWADALGR